jgi:hypothetical protein
MHAPETRTARARRLAYRLRGHCPASAAPQISESPRLHRDQVGPQPARADTS